MPELNIVADENMSGVADAFGPLGVLRLHPGRGLRRPDLGSAQMLLVRSVTRVDRELLEGSAVRFVGSATIGTDHVDLAYLREAGITFAHAPGCNAESAAEYVLAALLALRDRLARPLHDCLVGIVGCGNVGGRVRDKLRALGVQVLVNDPPLASAGLIEDHRDLDELVARCDVVSLHVPYETAGPHATRHLMDDSRIAALPRGALLINTARGPVVNEQALLDRMRLDAGLTAVLDVWEHEPEPHPELLERAAIATPHIAGYSLDGKLRGTEMVYRAACAHLGAEPVWNPWSALPPALEAPIRPTRNVRDIDLAALLVHRVYDPRVDDRAMRLALAGRPETRGPAFDRLRREYPLRREFAAFEIDERGLSEVDRKLLRGLGFALSEAPS